MDDLNQTDAPKAKSAAKPKLVTFHRMIPTARMPQRADRSAAGSLPTRAFRAPLARHVSFSFSMRTTPTPATIRSTMRHLPVARAKSASSNRPLCSLSFCGRGIEAEKSRNFSRSRSEEYRHA